MAFLSLKLTIGTLTALTVLIVAAVTLGITLSVSLTAIRDIGRANALALVHGALKDVTSHFERPSRFAEYLANRSEIELWMPPTSAGYSWVRNRSIDHVRDMTLLNKDVIDRVNVMFMDGSHVGSLKYEQYGVMEFEVTYPTPGVLLINGNRTYVNLTSLMTVPAPFVNNRYVNYALAGPIAAGVFQDLTQNISGAWSTANIQIKQGQVRLFYAAVVPMRGAMPRGSAIGYVHFAMEITTLHEFLVAARATPGTVAVLYDTNLLVASTSLELNQTGTTINPPLSRSVVVPNDCFITPNRDGIFCLPYIHNLSVPALDAVSSDRGFMLSTAAATTRLVHAGGEVFYVAQSYVQKPFVGNDLFVILSMPEQDVIGDVVKGRNLAIGLAAAIFVVAVALSFIIIYVLLAPLTAVSDRMFLAATLEDEAPDGPKSSMSEIAELQTAYEQMNGELQRLKAFVPHSVLYANKTSPDHEEVVEFVSAHGEDDDNVSRMSRRSSRDDSATVRSRTSRRSKLTAHSNEKSGAAAAGVLNTTMSVRGERVSVLVANLRNFNSKIAEAQGSVIVTAMEATVQAAVDAVRACNGVVDAFHGDQIVATFNAVVPCSAHPRRATQCAVNLATKLPTLGFHLRASIGIGTGKALVGNLGCASMKHFCVLGNVLPQATLLEQMTRLYPETEVIVPPRVAQEISTHFLVHPVDIVRCLPGLVRPGVISHVIGERSETKMDEWLYVLAEQSSDAASVLSAAYELAASGKVKEADAVAEKLAQTVKETQFDALAPAYERFRVLLAKALADPQEMPPCSDQGPFFRVLSDAAAISTAVPSTRMAMMTKTADPNSAEPNPSLPHHLP
jgi:class 3 adenylate cyclase